MAKGKNVLTTGDVAKICNVAPRTVSKWFDNGQLKGYRIPGSKDRRIPLSELIRFMKLHNMPTSGLPVGTIRVLIVDGSKDSAAQLEKILKDKTDYEVQKVHTNFETALAAVKFVPHVILLNLLSSGIDANDICKNIRAADDLQAVKILAVANKLSESEAAALIHNGFDGYISNPADAAEMIKKIEQATSIIY